MPELKITLNDGTEYAVEWCGASSGSLGFELTGEWTILQAAEVFSDPDKTTRIVYTYGPGMEEEYESYTQLATLNKERRTGNVIVSLYA